MLSDDELTRCNALMRRRENAEPVAYIVGARDFGKHRFTVTPDTLIPRPDSETLVDALLHRYQNRKKPKKIVDLGVGSGCLLLSLLAEWPDAYGVGADKSLAALRVARQNAQQLGVDARAGWLCGDWADAMANDKIDLIISNPPYVPQRDKASLAKDLTFEPQSALFSGEKGLDDYHKIIPQMRRLLAPGGLCAVEIGKGQERDVEKIAKNADFSRVTYYKDLSGVVRVLTFG